MQNFAGRTIKQQYTAALQEDLPQRAGKQLSIWRITVLNLCRHGILLKDLDQSLNWRISALQAVKAMENGTITVNPAFLVSGTAGSGA